MRYREMNMLTFKTRKTVVLYVLMGIVHSLLTMYVSIPLSSFFSISHTWNRNVWTIIIIICTIVVTLIEKKIYKMRYIGLLVTAILVIFISSFCCAIIAFIFTPSIMF